MEDEVVLKIPCRCIPVKEGLIYVMGTCCSDWYDVWTQVRKIGLMDYQFGFKAGSLGKAVALAIENYESDNLVFISEDDVTLSDVIVQ